jgi:hypothetical protein
LVSKKLDHISLYHDAKQKNDDKFAEQKDTWEVKDNFIERTQVRVLLTGIDKALEEEGRCWINIEERWRNFTDKFEQGSQINIRIPTVDEAEAESIRGKIQLVFHKPAIRNINGFNGEVSYQFETTFPREEFEDETYLSAGMVTVYISNGSLANSCEVVEVTETIKRYEIKCPEGMEVVND